MNREQVVGLLRHLLPFIGGMATARGWITQEGWAIFSEQLLQLAGPAITIAGLVWSYMDKTDKALVEKTIAIPEVSRVECMPTREGKELAESVPSEDVVVENVVRLATPQPNIEAKKSSARRVVQAYPKRR